MYEKDAVIWRKRNRATLKTRVYAYPVGASLLAMFANDNALNLNDGVVQTFFASKLGPTVCEAVLRPRAIDLPSRSSPGNHQ